MEWIRGTFAKYLLAVVLACALTNVDCVRNSIINASENQRENMVIEDDVELVPPYDSNPETNQHSQLGGVLDLVLAVRGIPPKCSSLVQRHSNEFFFNSFQIPIGVLRLVGQVLSTVVG